MPPEPIRSPEGILRWDAEKLLHDWRGYYQPMTVEHSAGGWTIRITLEPTATSIPVVKVVDPLAAKLATVSQCGRDVYGVMPPWPDRISKRELMDRLESARKFHSPRSVTRAAQQLHRLGLIVVPARGSNEGYGLSA